MGSYCKGCGLEHHEDDDRLCGRCDAKRRSLTLYELREANVARDAEVFGHLGLWSETDYATAVGGECGELLNLIKKMRRGDAIDKTAIAHEAADLLIYLDLLCVRLDIDLADAVRQKFDLVSVNWDCDIRLGAIPATPRGEDEVPACGGG